MSQQLTSENLTAQNRQRQLDHNGPLVESPNMETVDLPAAPAPEGVQRSESYVERNNHQQKRKYSADLYQYTKGMWTAVRDDIERRKAAGEHIPDSLSSSTETEKSLF